MNIYLCDNYLAKCATKGPVIIYDQGGRGQMTF